MIKTTIFACIFLAFLSIHESFCQKSEITVIGRVKEASSSQPIEYATVTLFSNQDSILTGTITMEDGSFEIASRTSEFYVKINFIGFEPLVIKDFEIREQRVDLQTQMLKADITQLTGAVVRAEKSEVEFKMDKRVFNVGKDLVSAGGSALDVLNNVPSVDVNIEGTISLRGNSNVQILINGKPSVLTDGNSLGTITSDMIDKIEVVTNPSAKYDAEGTTGIINIVIKKEERKGLNGAVTVNTGIPNNHSVGLSLNRRTEKFNLFSQLGVGKRTFISEYSTRTIDRTSDIPTEFLSDGDARKHEQFYNVILGTDYHINQWNVITLSGHFGYEIEDEDAETNYKSDNTNSSQRLEVTEAINPKYEYELNYKKSFENNKDRSLTASATGSFFGKDVHSSFEDISLTGDSYNEFQKNDLVYSMAQYSFQTDYMHPFSKKSTFETGGKYEIDDMQDDYFLANEVDGEWVIDESYTNIFDYDQKVAAAYVTYAYELEKFGVKLGSRIENTQLNTFLHNTMEESDQNYTNAFPSAHISYKFNKKSSLQTGYSRRIHRPRMNELNPFATLRDNYNLRTGNPDLKPEYTDAFEITAIQMWNTGSANVSVFHRRTNDVVSTIIDVTDNITISHPANIGKSFNTGIEFNGKVEPAKWLAVLMDAYFTSYKRTGTYNDLDFNFSNTTWSSRLTTKLKFLKDYDAEVRVRYRSKYKDVQSTSDAQAYADIGLKKKFMDGRAVINFSVSDVFSSRKRTSVSDMSEFYRYSENQRDGRRLILGFSYGFGKGEAMEFSGQKMF